MGKPSKRQRGRGGRHYPDAVPGSRAAPRTESWNRMVQRWEAGDGSLHRTRRAAADPRLTHEDLQPRLRTWWRLHGGRVVAAG